MTGVYITGHPLDDQRETLRLLNFSTAELERVLEDGEGDAEMLDGRTVDMGGILTEVKGKATRKGAYMGFCTLEDLTGQIECLVFPKVFERYQSLLSVDALVVLTGKLSVREEESPKLLVEQVTPLDLWGGGRTVPRPAPAPQAFRESAPEPQKPPEASPAADGSPKPAPPMPPLDPAALAKRAKAKLYLRLPRERLQEAMDRLTVHPGSLPVYLHIPEEKATMLAPLDHWNDGTAEGLADLAARFGEENVRLVKEGNAP